MVFFESVHRIEDCLEDMVETFGRDRPAFLGRELSKLHEQCLATSLGDLADRLEAGEIAAKGEFVIVVGGVETPPGAALDIDLLLTELAGSLPAKQAAAIAAKVSGEKRNALYQRILDLKA